MNKTTSIMLGILGTLIIIVGAVFLIFLNKKPVPPGAPVNGDVLAVISGEPNTWPDGRQCYEYNHSATKDVPVTTNEFIDMTVSGTKVSGTKIGTQSGPELTNGYTGTLLGTINGDTMTVSYAYTVEGSKNMEQEIYRVTIGGIDKLRYPLIDRYRDGLFPDTQKEYSLINYTSVSCDNRAEK